MLANALIGLREGLEAVLIISILVAYLVRTDRRHQLRWVWAGVGAAVALSLLAATVLQLTSTTLTDQAAQRFEGTVALIAVVFVTWMIFWMKRTGRTLSKELRNQLDDAVAIGPAAVSLLAFFAVVREGLETAIFLWASAQTGGSGVTAILGFGIGLAIAIAIGFLIYRSALKLDLGKFFQWTGVFLIILAAGVLTYAVHEFQEAGDLPGEDNVLFDVSDVIVPGSAIAAVLKGLFYFSPKTTVLEGAVWLTYVVVVLFFYLRKPKPAATTAVTEVVEPAPEATVAN